jgi:5-deoxy-glucuronate isomerase
VDLKHLSFAVLRLDRHFPRYCFNAGEEELAVDSYAGPVRVEVAWSGGEWSAAIPARSSIADPAPMLYIPAGANVTVTALDGPAHLSIAGALGSSETPPMVIEGRGIMQKEVGRDFWRRTVLTHIGDNVAATRLIAGETISRGGWSSFPPHKHDRVAPPSECPMEEVYYFLVEPTHGFGFIRVYTNAEDAEPFDHAFAVEHGDTVLIPRGYHPVAACPGYTLNYTWVLAGEGRTYGAWSDDPRHTWIRERS